MARNFRLGVELTRWRLWLEWKALFLRRKAVTATETPGLGQTITIWKPPRYIPRRETETESPAEPLP
jgi:hypothetical protein